MENPTEQHLRNIFRTKGLAQPLRFDTLDSILPLIEEVRKDGSTFIFKVDGERDLLRGDIYTILISGKKHDYIRKDCGDLLSGIKSVVYEYAKRCWSNGC
jgi:hypothetical protein